MAQGGVYIAIFCLAKKQRIAVGRLGSFWFRSGVYFYVGSAQQNLCARLERHSRKDKPLRWHIDYLSVRADMIGAVMVPGKRTRECELACELGRLYESVAPGFGASDCRCGGHLFYTPAL
ncbi:MAG: GIY-YIG nuclease family protein [Phycisphaerales bacterium]|nr:MAG: GIY-YIG nuclease family protein [Phycisphaerales bacterium]